MIRNKLSGSFWLAYVQLIGVLSSPSENLLPLGVMLCISNGVRENKPVSHNWKKGRGRLDLNQLVGNWAVKLHLTNSNALNMSSVKTNSFPGAFNAHAHVDVSWRSLKAFCLPSPYRELTESQPVMQWRTIRASVALSPIALWTECTSMVLV